MKKSNEDILNILKENITHERIDKYNKEQLASICELAKERATFKQDIFKSVEYFFARPIYELTKMKEILEENNFNTERINVAISFIDSFLKKINNMEWYFDNLHNLLKMELQNSNLVFKDIMPIFRLAIFGEINGPDVIKSIIILQKEETNARFDLFKNKFI